MATKMKDPMSRPRRLRPAAATADFDRIRCSECGRSYPALDGPALLYSLKASCPHCGGGFELAA